MPGISTHLLGTKIARETDYGVAPSALSTNAHNGSGWYQNGKWFNVVTEGMPTVKDKQAVIFPAGFHGKRFTNQQAPVVGRKWSEGEFTAPVTDGFIGLLLNGVLGDASHNGTPSTTATLLTAEPINTNPKSLVLASQPSDGGAILRFLITGTQDAGTISVCGIDVYGNGASELISFASAGQMYTRNSYSSIGASGIAFSGISNGSVTIAAFKHFDHIYSAMSGSSGITLSLERHGDPTAGAASKSLMLTGLVVKELTLNNPSDQVDGVFTAQATFEGQPTATCNATVLDSASMSRLWPAWTLAVTRDGGTTYNKVVDQSLKITSGARNQFAATGKQGPQSQFYGPAVEVTGDMTIQVTDELEFNRWRGASSLSLVWNWNTDWKFTSTQNAQLLASATAYVEDFDGPADTDGMQTVSLKLRMVNDENLGGPIRFKLFNRAAGAAM